MLDLFWLVSIGFGREWGWVDFDDGVADIGVVREHGWLVLVMMTMRKLQWMWGWMIHGGGEWVDSDKLVTRFPNCRTAHGVHTQSLPESGRKMASLLPPFFLFEILNCLGNSVLSRNEQQFETCHRCGLHLMCILPIVLLFGEYTTVTWSSDNHFCHLHRRQNMLHSPTPLSTTCLCTLASCSRSLCFFHAFSIPGVTGKNYTPSFYVAFYRQ